MRFNACFLFSSSFVLLVSPLVAIVVGPSVVVLFSMPHPPLVLIPLDCSSCPFYAANLGSMSNAYSCSC